MKTRKPDPASAYNRSSKKAQDAPREKTAAAKSAEMAYSYIRFSKRDQSTGDSLRRQTAAAKSWCERNGIRLDTTLRQDLGVSGFKGKHRENPDRHALAAFLKLVEDGRIARGSFLIIEALDRLTREHVRAGLTLLLGLIDKGIRIVQLSPAEVIYDESSDAMSLMLAIVELSRGHSESKMKSERVGEAYRQKKERVRQGEIMTHRLPAWIEEKGGKLVLVEWKAAIIRLIFQLYNAGYGLHALSAKLTKDGVKPIGDLPRWNRQYIYMILTDRRVLGEFQLMKPDRETPDGEAIKDYFPRVIDDAEYFAARASAAQRKRNRGANGNYINLFAGLMRHGRDGETIMGSVRNDPKTRVQTRIFLNTAGAEGRGKCYTFQAEPLEKAILSKLREIDERDIVGPSKAAEEVLALSGERKALISQIQKISAELRGGEVASVVRMLGTMEDELKEIETRLRDAQQRAASPVVEAWGECRQSINDVLENAPDKADARFKLRAMLRQIIDSIWCVFMQSGRMRFAAVQIYFSDSRERRDYMILYRPKNVCFGGPISEKIVVKSNVGFERGHELDLRNPDHAADLERHILRLWKEDKLPF